MFSESAGGTMPETLTESFCERCGTRYTFESVAQPTQKRLGKFKVLSKGLKNFVMDDAVALDEALAQARTDEERTVVSQQLDAFHDTFNFCMSCRQYTCANCWNDVEGRCQTCAPLVGADSVNQTASPGKSRATKGAKRPTAPSIDDLAWPTTDLRRFDQAGATEPAPNPTAAKPAADIPAAAKPALDGAQPNPQPGAAHGGAGVVAPEAWPELPSLADRLRKVAATPTESTELPVAWPTVDRAPDRPAAAGAAAIPEAQTPPGGDSTTPRPAAPSGFAPGANIDEALEAYEADRRRDEADVARELARAKAAREAAALEAAAKEAAAREVAAKKAAAREAAAREAAARDAAAKEAAARQAAALENAAREAAAAREQLARESAARVAAAKEAAARELAGKQAAARAVAEREEGERQAAERFIAEREAAQRLAAEHEAAQREAAERLIAEREEAHREAAEREAAEVEAAQLEAAQLEAAQLEAAAREALARQAAEREEAARDAEARRAEQAARDTSRGARQLRGDDRVEMPAWPVEPGLDTPTRRDRRRLPAQPHPIAASPESVRAEEPPQWPNEPAVDNLAFLANRTAAAARGMEEVWASSTRDLLGAAGAASAPAGVHECVSCGLSLSATARFCRRCGTRQA
jgi:hypothetical protein